jgi:hypothetical protein
VRGDGLDSSDLDMDQFRVLLNTAINIWIPQISENLFSSSAIISFSRKTLLFEITPAMFYNVGGGRGTLKLFGNIFHISQRGYNLSLLPASC